MSPEQQRVIDEAMRQLKQTRKLLQTIQGDEDGSLLDEYERLAWQNRSEKETIIEKEALSVVLDIGGTQAAIYNAIECLAKISLEQGMPPTPEFKHCSDIIMERLNQSPHSIHGIVERMPAGLPCLRLTFETPEGVAVFTNESAGALRSWWRSKAKQLEAEPDYWVEMTKCEALSEHLTRVSFCFFRAGKAIKYSAKEARRYVDLDDIEPSSVRFVDFE
jgi:hypothetical protein